MRDRNRVVDEGPRASGGTHTQLLVASALPVKLQQLASELTQSRTASSTRSPIRSFRRERVTVAAKRTDLTARGTLVKDQQARR